MSDNLTPIPIEADSDRWLPNPDKHRRMEPV